MSISRKIAKRLAVKLSIYSAAAQASAGNPLLKDFQERMADMPAPGVLELGVKRLYTGVKTKHDDWVPNAGEFLGTDIQDGIDVDIVADVHKLSETVGKERFDAIISCSSFEHFKYPHLAAHEIMKSLKIGGLLFIQTHQTYPVHGAPHDYFRFSREALAGLFGTQMGFNVIDTVYEFPAQIYTPEVPNIGGEPAFVNSCLLGEKTAKTPDEYIYEFDG
jgi:SAM-dependent methyltransferase